MIGCSEVKMSWYYSVMTGKSPWQTLEDIDRQEYLDDHRPEFMTVLDCNAKWNKGEPPPENLAYRGPFYLDWDGDGDIDSVLEDVRSFMRKLQEFGFDLRQASWWLSGRKGVHCTIPMACLMSEKSLNIAMLKGIPDLPDIYRSLAWELITPHLDMRVYTAKRGRMWRTTYRPRTLDNGQISWKVPIHPEQLLTLDEQGYWNWCSQKRPDIRPEDAQPNKQLGVLYSIATTNLKDQKKTRAKNKAKKLSFPNPSAVPTIQAVFSGDAVNQGKNLNDIKLQMAIAAVAVGMNTLEHEDQYIKSIEGFIEKRSQLKGITHSSKHEIEVAMREAFRYVAENNYFEYTSSGLRSILLEEYVSNLDYCGIDPKDELERVKFVQNMAGDMHASDLGVVQLTSKDVLTVSDYAWKPDSLQVIRDENGLVTHYSVVPVVLGKPLPRMVISLTELNNQAKFSLHIQKLGGHIMGLNTKESSRFRQALLNFAGSSSENTSELKATCLEGVYVDVADAKENEEHHTENLFSRFWVEAKDTYEGVISESLVHNKPFYVDAANEAGVFKTDLFNIPEQNKSELQEAVKHLLDLNGNTYSLSVVLGWFSACFIKHILYKLDLIKNFPLMQIVGQAGSGKTTTINLLLNLFSFKNKLTVLAANNTSRFAIEKRLVSSASIPVVVDEVKPQNVSPQWLQDFRGLLQVAYTIGSTVSKGGGNSAGSHYAELSNQPMLAPIAWLGESIDTSQTSLLERLVPAMFHLDDKVGRAEHVKFLSRNETLISALGYLMANRAITCDLLDLKNSYLTVEEEVSNLLYNGANDRIVSNAIAVTAGFDFFTATLFEHFGDVFTEKLKAMRLALLNKAFWTTEVASEVVMFMKSMSNASRESDISVGKILIGTHYRFMDGDSAAGRVQYLIVSAPRLFFSYRKRCKEIGVVPVYSSDRELHSVLKNASFAVDSFTDTSLGTDCIKIDVAKMEEAGVANFSTK